jgi:hypothetical protein
MAGIASSAAAKAAETRLFCGLSARRPIYRFRRAHFV